MSSYILDAIKKAEHEHDIVQFIDNDLEKKERTFFSKLWFWIIVLIIMNILSFTVLFWPKKPISSPQIHFVTPMNSQEQNELKNELK